MYVRRAMVCVYGHMNFVRRMIFSSSVFKVHRVVASGPSKSIYIVPGCPSSPGAVGSAGYSFKEEGNSCCSCAREEVVSRMGKVYRRVRMICSKEEISRHEPVTVLVTR